MPVNPAVKICIHVKVTGHPCGSPALRGESYCYFHQRMIRGVPTPSKARIHPMALIENEEAIQVALMETINAIVRNQIDLQRANLLIRALSIAVRNARRVRFDRCESEMIRKLPELQPSESQPAAPPQEAIPASVAEQSLPRAEPRGNSLAPHVSAGKAFANASSPEGTTRKLPAGVASAAIAQAQVANAHPHRE
ncbi:MAG: hypothetical protein WAU76_11095 [Candidatus Sulfotelmatobacter sp.]